MAVKKSIIFTQVQSFDFDSLSFEDLNSHYQMVGDIIASKKAAAESAFKEKIQEEASQLGIDINSLFGIPTEETTVKVKGTRKKADPKYRLPDGTEWSGKGIMKREFKQYLEENPDTVLDDLLINKEEEDE